MTVPTYADERQSMLEANVWTDLRRGPGNMIYSRSGPGPVGKAGTGFLLVRRGWLSETADGWEITDAGRVAAGQLQAGEIKSF